MAELAKPPVKINTAYDNNKALPFVPAGVAGLGALIAYKKGYGIVGFTTCIISGFIIGSGIKNYIKYGNLIGWH